MKPFPFHPGADPQVVGESLFERDWSLADVLEWFAGKKCVFCDAIVLEPPECELCFSDPPAEYGRDVLAAFLLAGGATHPRQVKIAREMKTWHERWAFERLNFSVVSQKLSILRLFSGPVEDGGVRIVRKIWDEHFKNNLPEILTPEQLLPTANAVVNCVAYDNVINAADYGVSEDNPDNTEALQRAVDAAAAAGGVVTIGPGRFTISRPLPFPRSD